MKNARRIHLASFDSRLSSNTAKAVTAHTAAIHANSQYQTVPNIMARSFRAANVRVLGGLREKVVNGAGPHLEDGEGA